MFLIDQADRANEQAANSLLKTLEEPPDHLILIMTAENVYDLLPTIRSRSVLLNFSPLTNEDMQEFARVRGTGQCRAAHRAFGRKPGGRGVARYRAVSEAPGAMLALLKTGAGAASYAAWLPISEALGRSKSEKLELYLKLLYDLLRDLTVLREGGYRDPQFRSAERSDGAGGAGFAELDDRCGEERG